MNPTYNGPLGALERVAPTVLLGDDKPVDELMASLGQLSGHEAEVAEQRTTWRVPRRVPARKLFATRCTPSAAGGAATEAAKP